MSIRHGVYIQEEATAVQVPKTGNSSVQVVVGTAPVNMAENPSEAVTGPILANSGTEAMACSRLVRSFTSTSWIRQSTTRSSQRQSTR